jgi:hypothetical protein
LGALEELYERYADDVAFFVVYIKEAHPEDGWVLEDNRRAGVRVADPGTEVGRAACGLRLKLRIPVLIDGMDNAVASAYGGWPERLYLIGRDGRIAYQGDEGPYGFHPPELDGAISAELATGDSSSL